MKLATNLAKLIFVIAIMLPAFAATSTQAQNSIGVKEERAMRTDPYVVFAGFLAEARIRPLESGASQPDRLQLFMKRSLSRRFVVADINANGSRPVKISFVDPYLQNGHVVFKQTRLERERKSELLDNFWQFQARGIALQNELVCIDGPEWYFAVRRNGAVTTGRVETCGVDEFESLGCELLGNKTCASIARFWFDGLPVLRIADE